MCGVLRLYNFCDVFGWCSLAFFSSLFSISFGSYFCSSAILVLYWVYHDVLDGSDICCFVSLFLVCVVVVGAREKS